MDCSMPNFPVLHHLLELAPTHVHQVGDIIQPSHPLSSPSPAFNLFQNQGLFQWVGSSYQVVKYWSFNLSISPPNEYSVLVFFGIDGFDLLAVQGTLKSLLQQHNYLNKYVYVFKYKLNVKINIFKYKLKHGHKKKIQPDHWKGSLELAHPSGYPLVSKMLGLITRSRISFNLASLIIEKWLQKIKL